MGSHSYLTAGEWPCGLPSDFEGPPMARVVIGVVTHLTYRMISRRWPVHSCLDLEASVHHVWVDVSFFSVGIAEVKLILFNSTAKTLPPLSHWLLRYWGPGKNRGPSSYSCLRLLSGAVVLSVLLIPSIFWFINVYPSAELIITKSKCCFMSYVFVCIYEFFSIILSCVAHLKMKDVPWCQWFTLISALLGTHVLLLFVNIVHRFVAVLNTKATVDYVGTISMVSGFRGTVSLSQPRATFKRKVGKNTVWR